MKYTFDMAIAKDYSIEIAVFLENLAYWTFKNLANRKHIYDGYCWSYNTYSAMTELFPCWTRRQCEYVVQCAEKEGLIVKGDYNKSKFDRTIWYALTPKAMVYFDHLLDEKYVQALKTPIAQNCDMGRTKLCDPTHRIVRPIPDVNTDSKLKTLLAESKPDSTDLDSFQKFWNLYPKKVKKKASFKIWKSRGLESKIGEILEKLELQIRADDQWKQGFIPHPSTYLNGEYWEDEINISPEELARRRKSEGKKAADEIARKRLAAQDAVTQSARAKSESTPKPNQAPYVSLKDRLSAHVKNLHQKATSEIENLGSNLVYGSSSPEIGT